MTLRRHDPPCPLQGDADGFAQALNSVEAGELAALVNDQGHTLLHSATLYQQRPVRDWPLILRFFLDQHGAHAKPEGLSSCSHRS